MCRSAATVAGSASGEQRARLRQLKGCVEGGSPPPGEDIEEDLGGLVCCCVQPLEGVDVLGT